MFRVGIWIGVRLTDQDGWLECADLDSEFGIEGHKDLVRFRVLRLVKLLGRPG